MLPSVIHGSRITHLFMATVAGYRNYQTHEFDNINSLQGPSVYTFNSGDKRDLGSETLRRSLVGGD